MASFSKACLLCGLFFFSRGAFSHAEEFPDAQWRTATPEAAKLDAALLAQARDYAQTCGGAGCVVRGGTLIVQWGDVLRRHDLKSSTKGIGVTALGLAMQDGLLKLEDKAAKYHPSFGVPPEENRASGWRDEVTLFHLATQTAGFAKRGGYEPLLFRPGAMWHYSDGGPNWLAECITLVYRRDLQELMFERVFTPLGIARDDLQWRANQYRPTEIDGIPRREFGAGIHANADALARIGLFYLREGRWRDRQIIPKEFVATVRSTPAEIVDLAEHSSDSHGDASRHYGLLWWNNNDGALAGVPRDAFWCWGLFDSLVVVIPSLDLVIGRVSDNTSWPRVEGEGHYAPLAKFLEPVALAAGFKNDETAKKSAATNDSRTSNRSQQRPAKRIAEIHWAPKETIVRQAQGSDNWPLTWADDDALYTAYGDGRGFQPFVQKKLSLGLARIEGPVESFRPLNLRSPSLERTGEGRNGPKASGMLMVEGTLYLLARNVGNSQLVWSADHGQTWTWSDWKFETSMGCPSFVNFGRNYDGARDEFVYLVSFDNDSAYEASDRTILARAPKEKLRERAAYEFFAGRGEDGSPCWSHDIGRRESILSTNGRCYRTAVTYNAGLGIYLLVQLPGGDTRYEGGLSIYQALEPWGPWEPTFQTEAWDVGPGESASFPSKWIGDSGREAYLVFSGDDCFSLRKATFKLRE